MNLCVSSNMESVWYELEERAHDYFILAFSTQIVTVIICELIVMGVFSEAQIKYLIEILFIMVISVFTNFNIRIDDPIARFNQATMREIMTEEYGVVHKKKMIFHFIAYRLAFTEICLFSSEYVLILFMST